MGDDRAAGFVDAARSPTSARLLLELTARGHRPTAAVRVAQLGQGAGLIGAADLART